MVERRVSEAMEAMHGRLLAGDAQRRFRGAALDSRLVVGGELFFAVEGERTDGHRFVGAAVERGAAAAVISTSIDAPGATLIRVDETLRALHDLTRHVRRQVPERLVAVTGSAGKTTTKDLLTAMLARRYRTAASPGNLNNLLGFPLALLGIDDDVEWMVAEMAMSTPGELGGVSRLGRPDVAVFTNVRPAHLAAFGGEDRDAALRRITDAKAELLEGLAIDGLIVANAGDDEVCRILERGLAPPAGCGRRAVRYALADRVPSTAGLSLWADGVELDAGGSRFVLHAASGEAQPIDLPLHGAVNVENFLAAAACAHALEVPLAEIAAIGDSVRAARGRGEVHRLRRRGWLVDDSYNSNPDALEQALVAAKDLPGSRHWAVLGDMLELGAHAPHYHRQAGRVASRLGYSPVVAVGEASRQLAAAAAQGGSSVHWFADAGAAVAWCTAALQAGDVVLVKGSRGIGLELVSAALLRAGGAGE